MKILVVGGAGYIGSFMTRVLQEQGYEPVVLDNLSTGHRASVDKVVTFINGNISDPNLLKDLFKTHAIEVVMHFSAFSLVGESIQAPLLYYRNNVANTLHLLSAMADAGVEKFIFSSTAAIFGNPVEVPITESHPKNPINPYGHSKNMIERILEDLSAASGLRYVSLRYFNAAGGHPAGTMGEDHRNETHLIPLILKSLLDTGKEKKSLTVFGTDYNTTDGTCVRDYIHILDLAQAHMLALKYLISGGVSDCFNLGNGKGFSVLEVIKAAENVTGRKVPVTYGERRSGDPAVLVAGSGKIIDAFNWKPEFDSLEEIIGTAWKWHSSFPEGYND